MPTLSLAMIVKNEAANLPRCLASVRALVDELVVVDTGSTDDTCAIAASFGAKVGHFAWTEDFSAARNESLRQCSGDWVLILDADEAVEEVDHRKIRKACLKGERAAYQLTLRNYFLDGGSILFDRAVLPNDSSYALGSEYPFYADFPSLRLCRRLPDLQFEGRVHELLNPYFQQRKLTLGTLPVVIHHFGKVDFAREKEKGIRYLRMAEAQVAADPGHAQSQFNLMVQAVQARDWACVIKAGKACLDLHEGPSTTTLSQLGLAHLELDQPAEALPYLRRVLAQNPTHPLALSTLIFSLARLNLFEEAHELLRTGLPALPRFPNLRSALAETLLRQGRIPETETALREGIAVCPLDSNLRDCLLEFDRRLGREAQMAADAWAALQAMPDAGGGDWHVLVAGFLQKEENHAEAKAVIDLGLVRHPTHQGLLQLKTLMG